MSTAAVDTRIFVVGVPRSGTTLLQSLLAAHSRVASFTESHFFSRHFRFLPGSSVAVLARDPTARVREFLEENRVSPSAVAGAIEERLADALPPKLLLPLGTRGVARELLRGLDDLARDRSCSNWVEKTPRHLRYVPFLERLAGPEQRTRFVHVIRNGMETVASLFTASKHWERSYDLDACVARWNGDVAFSLGRSTSDADRFVFYEELTSQPEAVLERLLAGLDLDWEPEILDRYAQGSEHLVRPDETWKSGIGGGVRPSATSERALDSQQRQRVSRLLRADLYDRLFELGDR